VVAPGADGVEVGKEGGGQVGGEEFAVEFGGELGGEVFGHDEGDEEGVARGPGRGGVVEEVELYRKGVGGLGVGAGGAVGGDEGVDAVGVDLELVELIGGEGGDGAVGGGTELEVALEAVVFDEGGAEDLGELAGAVAAEGVHLEEAVGGGDVALGEEEIVEGGGVDGGYALRVAGDGDGRGEAGDREVAVELRKGGAEVAAEVDGEKDGGEEEQKEEDAGGEEEAFAPGLAPDAAGFAGGWCGVCHALERF
jgi:hypothetical protein